MASTPEKQAEGAERDRRAPIDAIGPHDDAPPSRGIVQSGGTSETEPIDFDDDEIYSGRGRTRDGGTTQAAGGDSGKLGPPAEQLSSSNGPSDPAGRKAKP